jgi:endoglucanase
MTFLRAVGGKLTDPAGREFKVNGVNWFGFETSTCAPHGLNERNWLDILRQMRASGFNVVRLPYSNQLLDNPSCAPQGIDYGKNPDLQGLRGLPLLDKVISGAGRVGLQVILDRHSGLAGEQKELWYTPQVPESRWISDWVMLARHYLGNPVVIGADLYNEPHGPATWGDGVAATDWRAAAERAGNAILAVNPDWLILVQGIQFYRGTGTYWGSNLVGAAVAPVRLSRPDKLVYAPHEYSEDISPAPWFHVPGYPDNLPQVFDQHWGYLAAQGQVVLVGEYGSHAVGGKDPGGVWMRSFATYVEAHDIGAVYWAWNGDSTDTDGIVRSDWKTVNQRQLDALPGHEPPVSRLPVQGSPKPAGRAGG